MKRASDLHSILEETTQIICQQPSYFCFPLHRDCISLDSSGIKMLLSNTAGGADGRMATVYKLFKHLEGFSDDFFHTSVA